MCLPVLYVVMVLTNLGWHVDKDHVWVHPAQFDQGYPAQRMALIADERNCVVRLIMLLPPPTSL